LHKNKLLIGTSNKGKFKEFKFYIEHFKIFNNLEVVDTSFLKNIGEPNENGNSFEENAKIKSDFYFKNSKIPSLSDDSGFIIDGSDNFPGIRTARLASDQGGVKNAIDYIFQKNNVPDSIEATFFCSISYKDRENDIVAKGDIKGKIIHEPRGDNGFGFDPFFQPSGFDKTFAEMRLDKKLIISHRYKAFYAMTSQLSKVNSVIHN
jgi:XTP/dITP diphosphohydrolase